MAWPGKSQIYAYFVLNQFNQIASTATLASDTLKMALYGTGTPVNTGDHAGLDRVRRVVEHLHRGDQLGHLRRGRRCADLTDLGPVHQHLGARPARRPSASRVQPSPATAA